MTKDKRARLLANIWTPDSEILALRWHYSSYGSALSSWNAASPMPEQPSHPAEEQQDLKGGFEFRPREGRALLRPGHAVLLKSHALRGNLRQPKRICQQKHCAQSSMDLFDDFVPLAGWKWVQANTASEARFLFVHDRAVIEGASARSRDQQGIAR
jgi:hypothetical protein